MIEITNEMRVWMTPHSDYTDERMENNDLNGLVFLPMDQDMTAKNWLPIGTATVHARLSGKSDLVEAVLDTLSSRAVEITMKAVAAIAEIEVQIRALTEDKA